MTAQLIDGNALSKQLRAEVATRAAALTAQGVKPGLAVVLVGDNPASQVYVRNKVKACEDAGLHSVLEKYADTMTEAELLARGDALNKDPAIHGILVQLPLPKGIDAHKVIEAIAPEKDVDGFHVASAGALMVGQDGFKPCTPYGCLLLLQDRLGDLSGKDAIVVGRSILVGKPMGQLLLGANCTVTMAHSRTKDLPGLVRRADIVVAAVGRAEMVKGDWIKPGAIVIDVGINRLLPGEGEAKGRLVGDVDYAEAAGVADAITPVPGGVGPMTIACLLRNTLVAAHRRAGLADPKGF